MKKFSLFILALLCLCANVAWADIAWMGETPMDNSQTTRYFYIKSVQADLYINGNHGSDNIGTLRTEPDLWQVLWQESNPSGADFKVVISRGWENASDNEFSLNINKSGNVNLEHPTNWGNYEGPNTTEISESTTNTSLNAWKIHRVAKTAKRMNRSGNSLTAQLASETATESSDWLFISENQYNNHIAMVAYEAANARLNAFLGNSANTDAANYPAGYWASHSAPTSSKDITRYLSSDDGAWMCTSDESSTINGHTTTISNWLSEVEGVRVAYAYALEQLEIAELSGYDASAERATIAACSTADAINAAVETLRTNAKSYISTHRTEGMDMSIYMVNPTVFYSSSNQGMPDGWNYYDLNGGNGNRVKHVASDANPSVDTYMEFYFYDGERSSFRADYYQAVKLPAGRYRISADIFFNGNDGVYALYAYVNTDNVQHTTSVNGGDAEVFNKYTLDFDLSAERVVNIGVKKIANASSGNWMGADNFKIVCLSPEYAVSPAATKTADNWTFSSGATSSGWTNKRLINYGSSTDLVECYNDANTYIGDVMYYRFDGLDNGFYTAEVELNVHCADWNNNYPAETSKANKDNVAVLKANNQRTTSPLQNDRNAVGSSRQSTISYIYVNDGTLTFTLSTLVTGANWLSVKINSLTYLGPNTYDLTVSSAGWASLCLPFAADIPDGITAYYAKATTASTITLSPITATTIAANEPIVVNAVEGTYTFHAASSAAESISGNLLGGVTQYTDFTSGDKYVLAGVNAGVPYFAKLLAQTDISASSAFLPAYKAYIDASTITGSGLAPERISLVIEDTNNATSIETTNCDIKAQKVLRDGQILILRGNEAYDLIGRRLK